MSKRSVAQRKEPQRSIRCVSSFERQAREQGFTAIAGVDEVGRGCLFGPVTAAAVILDEQRPIRGLSDSKILAIENRELLAKHIKRKCVAWAVGSADVFEIDGLNIYQASRLAMKRAVCALSVRPDYLLVDALKLDLEMAQRPLIDGDARCRAIAAASIVAKVHRDEMLARWDEIFPQYNLKSNKGYSTPCHRRALREHGPTYLHRFSFAPVRESCAENHWLGYWTTPSMETEERDEVAT